MNESVLMSELSWNEYQRRIIDEQQPVLLPIGAIEQHGPHLPLATDLLVVQAIAEYTAKKVGGIVAPPLCYGYKSQCRSGGGNHFCGTTSLDADTLIKNIVDLAREFGRHGVRKLVMVDVHFENDMFVIEASDLAIRELKREGIDDFKILKPNMAAITNLENIKQFYPEGFTSMSLEHAGKLETSVMLYLHPQLVDVEKYPQDELAQIPPYDTFPPAIEHVPSSGVLCPVSGACREMGKIVFDDLVDGWVDSINAVFP